MELNDIFVVEIVGLDHQGRGIAKINDKVVFIPNALVGESVEIKMTTIKKKYSEGIVTKLINESDKRIKAICPYFDECGGCDLMHMSYNDQLEYKENKVKEIITKFSNVSSELVKPIIKCDNILGYRNKVTLQVEEKIGLYKKKSYDIVDIDKCLISDDVINNIINKLKQITDLSNINQIVIRSSNYTKEVMVVIYASNKVNELEIVEILKDDVVSITLYVKGHYKNLYGQSYITEHMNDLQFQISSSSFFQINTNQAVKLYDNILKLADLQGTERVIDLYCGTGTIGLYLSRYCKEVIGVESNIEAIADANKNKELNNTDNIEFIHSDVNKLDEEISLNPDLIIVDPPRDGLKKEIILKIKELNPDKMIYVSCNPVTLARDIKELSDLYEVKEIVPVDMFANTNHVESIVLMTSFTNEVSKL